MAEVPSGVPERVAATAAAMGERLGELTTSLHQRLADEIDELQGDPQIQQLLDSSIGSNLQSFVHVVGQHLPVDEVAAPPAAIEYAHRLAQRGTSPNALLRAYRLGQAAALSWAIQHIAQEESNRDIAVAAALVFVDVSFTYIDRVSEQVVAAYASERERWLSDRSSLRVATLAEVIADGPVDLDAADASLGYRLRQHHLGAILWREAGGSGDLRELEKLLAQAARAVGGTGAPLYVPRDNSSGWGWIPFGRLAAEPPTDLTELGTALAKAGVRLSLGLVGAGVEGFRTTHDEARRAQDLALVAGDAAGPITTWAEPDMRAAIMLAADPVGTQRLVETALGGLAADTDSAARLRETVLVYLSEKNSLAATAAAMHLHKNTVKYRIARAAEARGRPLDEGRLDLELALIACKWMGASVLSP